MPRLLVELRGMRRQEDAGKLVGLSQYRISRAEQGRYPLTPDQADAYARALGASAIQRHRLVQLASAHQAENLTGRKHLIRSAHVIQRRISDLEAGAHTIRSWTPDVVTGLLQTHDYTVAVAGEHDERWWAPRRARLALLDDPGRSFHLLICEAALRWGVGSAETMAKQMDHLIEIGRRPHVQVGIIPIDGVRPIPMPRGFQLYDHGTASVATEVGTTFVTAPDLQLFIDDFTALADLALYADAARTVLGRIGDQYRANPAGQGAAAATYP